jgi:adenine-specific DNA-methyltransferase
MVEWALADRPRRILDPAVGPGAFLDAIERYLGNIRSPFKSRIDLCDIDGRMIRGIGEKRRGVAIQFRHEDFIAGDFRPYDAIVANPPYVRHHRSKCPESVFREFDRMCRRRISRLTNLYGLFLIKIWSLLAPRGRAAVILPAEWLNADFGVPLKAYLLEENAIDAIVHFNPTSRIFDGALTTSAIILLRKGRTAKEMVRWCSVSNAASLIRLDLDRQPSYASNAMNPAAKWSSFFDRPRTSEPSSAKLGDVARCVRGIATGANDYFTLNESDRRRWDIDRRDLKHCITKANHLDAGVLYTANVRRLIEEGDRIYLLSPRQPLSGPVRKYLAEGRRRRITLRYLPKHRPRWYMPEQRQPAPILVSVFARGKFKFVLNRAGVLHLTAYHGIYPRSKDARTVRRLFEYFTSDKGQRELRRHCRIYADGLLKVEPRDVQAMSIPPSMVLSEATHK